MRAASHSKPDILRYVCRRSHVRKIIWKSFWLFYNIQCKPPSACLLVPDTFENNTKSNFHSAPHFVLGSYLARFAIVNQSDGGWCDDDDQIRIYSRNLLVFPLALHVVKLRTEVKINQMGVSVWLTHAPGVSRIPIFVFVFFIKKFNYAIIAVSLAILYTNCFFFFFEERATLLLIAVASEKTSWFAVWKRVSLRAIEVSGDVTHSHLNGDGGKVRVAVKCQTTWKIPSVTPVAPNAF